MSWAKEQYIAYLEFEEERNAAYEEGLRLSMACTQLFRPLSYDLYLRILELAWLKQCSLQCAV